LLLLLTPLGAQTITGRVLDAATGEPVSGVRVEIVDPPAQTLTGAQGRFDLRDVPPGLHLLRIYTTGYQITRLAVHVEPGAAREIEVRLQPAALRRAESVTVEAGPYASESEGSLALAGPELTNLASVLTDDPLRAVQALPGVTSSDDFQSQFALRGAGFRNIGLYLDGVLLHSPFHGVQSDPSSASVTLFNGDALDSINLNAGPIPPAFADRTAGALDLRSREGSRDRVTARLIASMSNVAALAEGPLRRRKGSWLVAARKSYLQYIINRVADDQGLTFGFSDAQVRVSYDLTASSQVSASLLHGASGLDRTRGVFGPNAIFTSDYQFTLAQAAWKYTPNSKALIVSRGVWLGERYDDRNIEPVTLGGGNYGEWISNTDAAMNWTARSPFEAGWSVRRLREDRFTVRRALNPPRSIPVNAARGTGLRLGGYAQQSWFFGEGQIRLSAGGRWDRHDVNGLAAVSPFASLAVRGIRVAWGQSAQFPELADFFSIGGRRSLRPERSRHLSVSWERRIRERTRVRVEVFERRDREQLFTPAGEPRLVNGRVFNPSLTPRIENSVEGRARGWQVFLQRRSANRLAGWVSYSFTSSRYRDAATGLEFPADYEQRHAVNVYGSWRIRPTVNLSAKWLYGTGLPLRGFYREESPGVIFLSSERNRLRLPSYQRTDVRLNKTFPWRRVHFTLFAEAINVFAHDNYRLDDFGSYDQSGRARPRLEKTLPFIPSAGAMIEF